MTVLLAGFFILHSQLVSHLLTCVRKLYSNYSFQPPHARSYSGLYGFADARCNCLANPCCPPTAASSRKRGGRRGIRSSQDHLRRSACLPARVSEQPRPEALPRLGRQQWQGAAASATAHRTGTRQRPPCAGRCRSTALTAGDGGRRGRLREPDLGERGVGRPYSGSRQAGGVPAPSRRQRGSPGPPEDGRPSRLPPQRPPDPPRATAPSRLPPQQPSPSRLSPQHPPEPREGSSLPPRFPPQHSPEPPEDSSLPHLSPQRPPGRSGSPSGRGRVPARRCRRRGGA